MKHTIVFYDAHADDQAYFKTAFEKDFEIVTTQDPLSPETVGLAATADVLSVHTSSKVTAEVMAKLPNLKHVACRTTGFDHVDLSYAAEHGITVSTVPNYGEDTVAEYAFMLMLAVSRRVMPAAQAVHDGLITPEALVGHDLARKTLGVIGTGRIGRHVATIGRGFSMNVVAYDPFPNADAAREIGFEYRPLGEVLASADYISLHTPATPETHHLLNAAAFAKMKPGVFIINTARGMLIDTLALIGALESGKVAGAGLDVLEGEEYLQFESELHLLSEKKLGAEAQAALRLDVLEKMPNVLVTPHNAYNSAEALGRIRDISAANIRSWDSGSPQNLVHA